MFLPHYYSEVPTRLKLGNNYNALINKSRYIFIKIKKFNINSNITAATVKTEHWSRGQDLC